VPPDSVPADIWQQLDPLWQAPADVFGVTFEPGLSRERKTELVTEVGGISLVGGRPFSDNEMLDGIYLIRIRTDGSMDPLRRAVAALRDSPGVVSAFVLTSFRSGT
jgi:hypothetical protein